MTLESIHLEHDFENHVYRIWAKVSDQSAEIQHYKLETNLLNRITRVQRLPTLEDGAHLVAQMGTLLLGLDRAEKNRVTVVEIKEAPSRTD